MAPPELYVRLHANWMKFGVRGEWISPEGQLKRYKYFIPGDGFRYWAMSATLYPIESRWASKIINRTRIEGAEEWYAEQIKAAKAQMTKAKRAPRRRRQARRPAAG